jgi:uncharacterized membrane protein
MRIQKRRNQDRPGNVQVDSWRVETDEMKKTKNKKTKNKKEENEKTKKNEKKKNQSIKHLIGIFCLEYRVCLFIVCLLQRLDW